jgi:hypothetical protein
MNHDEEAGRKRDEDVRLVFAVAELVWEAPPD